MATELHETILRLERTTARVTELTALRTARPDRDLVVALQDFDRLQQEFVSFADTFASAAAKSPESWQQSNEDGHPAGDAVAKIPLTDLKARILRQLCAADEDFAEVVFYGQNRPRFQPNRGVLELAPVSTKRAKALAVEANSQSGARALLDDAAQTFCQFRNLVGPQRAKIRSCR